MDDKLTARRPIAIFVHVYYPAVWDWIATRIAQTIQQPFHLILTTPLVDANLGLPNTPFMVSNEIVVGENRGRDILPFINNCSKNKEYQVGLKLHTKRSTHRLDGANWGKMLVSDLLPTSEDVSRLLTSMENDPRLGLVGPDGMLVSVAPWMLQNAKAMREISGEIGLPYPRILKSTPVFCAGSMFWFQKRCFNTLERANIDYLFEPEKGQVDGTAAHALERLFSPIVEASGGVVTTMRGAILSQPDMKIDRLVAISRSMADQRNDFLAPLSRTHRILLKIPGLRKLYHALPVFIRRWARALLLTRNRSK